MMTQLSVSRGHSAAVMRCGVFTGVSHTLDTALGT